MITVNVCAKVFFRAFDAAFFSLLNKIEKRKKARNKQHTRSMCANLMSVRMKINEIKSAVPYSNYRRPNPMSTLTNTHTHIHEPTLLIA